MVHFTEYLNFSERPNAGEQGLEDTWDLLQGCPVTRARVRHGPMKEHEHKEQLHIILIGNQKGGRKTLANPKNSHHGNGQSSHQTTPNEPYPMGCSGSTVAAGGGCGESNAGTKEAGGTETLCAEGAWCHWHGTTGAQAA